SALEAARYVGGVGTTRRESMRTLAEETGANTVVGGALYRRGDQLFFRVQVADRRGSRLVGMGDGIVAPTADPRQGGEELRNRVMGWLSVQFDERLRGTPGASNRPPTYEAYRAFAEGMARYVAVDNAGAAPLFLRAYERDTTFTSALLHASIALTNLGRWF